MEHYLCRRRTNLVADWNSCLMPRDTDRRLLGLWGFELSVERRKGGSDRVRNSHLPRSIHGARTPALNRGYSGDEQAGCAGDIKWRQAGVKYDKVSPLGTSEERTLQSLLLSNVTVHSQFSQTMVNILHPYCVRKSNSDNKWQIKLMLTNKKWKVESEVFGENLAIFHSNEIILILNFKNRKTISI